MESFLSRALGGSGNNFAKERGNGNE